MSNGIGRRMVLRSSPSQEGGPHLSPPTGHAVPISQKGDRRKETLREWGLMSSVLRRRRVAPCVPRLSRDREASQLGHGRCQDNVKEKASAALPNLAQLAVQDLPTLLLFSSWRCILCVVVFPWRRFKKPEVCTTGVALLCTKKCFRAWHVPFVSA